MKYIPLIIGLLLMALLSWEGATAQTRYQHKMEGVCLTLKDVCIDEDTVCITLQLVNRSPLSYTMASQRYSIRDSKVIRRHAYQEIPQRPLWVKCDGSRIEAGQQKEWKVAFLQETLSKNQRFTIDIYERHGARNLQVSLSWRRLLKAKIVNEL
jgi:hypothetical protein